MRILSWFSRSNPQSKTQTQTQTQTQTDSAKNISKLQLVEAPGMNGAMEVQRPDPPIASDISVFEFGSVAASADKVTLAGYCPVSDDLEPCRWEILPASSSDAPQFRVVF